MLERLGRYEFLERIASGGQGTVYRARDTVLDRIVAVKVINQQVTDDPAYLDALQREAKLAAGLDHPNITTVYDFQVENGTAFIVMEYVPDALDKHISQGRRLPWRRSVEIALQVARALEYAHENGVVHRDIKPQNILLRESGAVAVSDFGIARALASSTRSRTASVTGTLPYLAPEQWSGGEIDGRLDQYALGIVLYEIIAGKQPFQGDSYEALFVQHRDAAMPPWPADLEVPVAVDDVIRRAIEKNPDARYASAGAMAVALEGSLSGGDPDQPRRDASQPPSPQPTPVAQTSNGAPESPPSDPMPGNGHIGGFRRRFWLAGAGVAVIAAIAIVVITLRDDDVVVVIVPAATPTPAAAATVTPLPIPTSSPAPQITIAPTRPPTLVSRATVVSVTRPTPTFTPRPTPTFTPRPTPTPVFMGSYNRGSDYLERGQYRSAINEFTTTISLNPTFMDAYRDRGFAYSELGSYNEAIIDYTAARDLDPSNPQIFRGLGIAYDELDRYSEAIEAYGQALRFDPKDQVSLRNRTILYSTTGLYMSVVDGYTELMIESPNDADLYYFRSNAHFQLNHFVDAMNDIERAIMIKPNYATYISLRNLISPYIN